MPDTLGTMDQGTEGYAMTDNIITELVFPPIPDRSHDWCAYRDPEGRIGWGRTEDDAIKALLMQEEEDE